MHKDLVEPRTNHKRSKWVYVVVVLFLIAAAFTIGAVLGYFDYFGQPTREPTVKPEEEKQQAPELTAAEEKIMLRERISNGINTENLRENLR